ncbi:MAG: DMT family transporter [Desulfovibrionaceae bacterium]
MKNIYVLVALLAGAMVPLQAGINVRLKQAVGDPLISALVSFAVGTLVLLASCAFLRPLGNALAGARGPWWMWTGGLLGAFFVAATILLAEKLGAGAMLAWIIASQLLAGMLMDHYGLIGYAVREVSLPRLAGALLLVAGAVLVQKY